MGCCFAQWLAAAVGAFCAVVAFGAAYIACRSWYHRPKLVLNGRRFTWGKRAERIKNETTDVVVDPSLIADVRAVIEESYPSAFGQAGYTIYETDSLGCWKREVGSALRLRKDFPELGNDGWLVLVVYAVVHSWTRWVSPNGWRAFFRVTHGELRGRTACQDSLHLSFAVLSVALFSVLAWNPLLWGAQLGELLAPLAFAVSSFKCIDLFFDFSMLAIFGNRYGRAWQSAMAPRRLSRTLLIDLLLFVELLFWNGTLAYTAARAFPRAFIYCSALDEASYALQLSLATMTTIGYGTFAPVSSLAVCLAVGQAVSAVLLLTGVMGGIFSRVSSGGWQASPRHASDDPPLPEPWETKRGLFWRRFLPLALPTLFVLATWYFTNPTAATKCPLVGPPCSPCPSCPPAPPPGR